MATYSANEPQWVKPGWVWWRQTCCCPAWHSGQAPQPQTKGTVTRSPTCQRVTSLPTAATKPASSWPGTCGSTISGSWPIQPCQSLRQMPVASTLMTAPWGAGAGSATVVSFGVSANAS